MDFTVLSKHDAKQYSPAALAFLGDALYGLYVRDRLVRDGSLPANTLHKRSVGYVCARAQAVAVDRVLPMLSEEEESIYRRGRNASSPAVPRHAKTADYRKATGLECLFGFLCLTGESARASELFEASWEAIEGESAARTSQEEPPAV